MTEQVKPGNKMADMPIAKLIVTMALPMMLSMMIQALYNIVDSVFIGMLPERAEALQALGYAYPVQMLMVALGVGTGVGAGALLSKALGMNDGKKADSAAGNGYFLMLCFTLVFAIFGLCVFFGGVYLDICTSNAVVAEYGRQYLGICLIFSLGQFVQLMGERTLCSTGRTNLAMIMQLAGALTNIALDPLFIFVFDMGIVGAAVATVIGQWVAMIVGFILDVRLNKEIRVSVKAIVTPSARSLGDIFKVGLPAVVLQCLQSLTTLVMQITFGFLYSGAEKDMLVGIYGIFYKLQYFVLMLVYGLNNAAIPVIAFNYGMGNGERVKRAIGASTIVAVIIGVLGLVLFEAAPEPLLRCFNASDVAVGTLKSEFTTGVRIMRISATAFPLAACSIIFAAAFQALGLGLRSMTVALIRLLVVLMPACYLMGRFFGADNIWWGSVIAEAAAFVYALATMLFVVKKYVSPLDNYRMCAETAIRDELQGE